MLAMKMEVMIDHPRLGLALDWPWILPQVNQPRNGF
jgi:hypothetical protein